MIVYFKCLCMSTDRIKAQQLKAEGHEIKVVDMNPQYRKEAKAYGVKLPFKVIDGEASPLYE